MTRRARGTPESRLQLAIVKALTLALGGGSRGFVIEQNAVKSRRVKRGPKAGIPDLQVVLTRGRVLWIEIKTPTGELEDSQVDWHMKAIKLSHVVFVCRSVQEAIDVVSHATKGDL